MTLRRGGAVAVVLSVLLSATNARATLEDDASRVEATWAGERQVVSRIAPVFLELGGARHVDLGVMGADELASEGCTSVAILGPRGADFMVRTRRFARDAGPNVAKPERAAAGLVFLTRCGDERRDLEGLGIEMRSLRAAFEVVVARGASPASSPVEGPLLERYVGPARPPIDPGRALSQETIDARASRVEARARGDGATSIATQVTHANEEGQGRVFFGLKEGCHRLELLSELGSEGRVADLDAELRDATTNAMLARDRSDTPDARLDVCAGEAGPTLLTFGGAPANARIALMDAAWPLPVGVPSAWGARARGFFAMGLQKRHAPALKDPPIAQSLGVSGTTLEPLELTPGDCYVASVASIHGETRQMMLTAQLEGKALRDDGGHEHEGATIAFCSRTTERMAIRVDARGASLSWVFAVWRVGPAPRDGDGS